MSRPQPSQNVSFQDSAPPSRRTHQNPPLPAINTGSQTPPRPPAKSGPSKSSFTTTSSQPAASPLDYGHPVDDYVDVQNQGFSASNGATSGDFRRKKSMVRPDRERIDPNHRLWHYREHAADGERGGLGVLPSSESARCTRTILTLQPPATNLTMLFGARVYVVASHFSRESRPRPRTSRACIYLSAVLLFDAKLPKLHLVSRPMLLRQTGQEQGR